MTASLVTEKNMLWSNRPSEQLCSLSLSLERFQTLALPHHRQDRRIRDAGARPASCAKLPMTPVEPIVLAGEIANYGVSCWRSSFCYASQTRKSDMGQRATAPHRSRRRYRVRMETTRAGPHERDLCQFGSIADLVRTKQKSPLHPGMAAENVADAGRSRPQQRSLRTPRCDLHREDLGDHCKASCFGARQRTWSNRLQNTPLFKQCANSSIRPRTYRCNLRKTYRR